MDRISYWVNLVVYTTIDQTLVNSLNGLLNCEIGGLDCRVYNIHVSIVYTCITFCNALVHVIYFVVSGNIRIQYSSITQTPYKDGPDMQIR